MIATYKKLKTFQEIITKKICEDRNISEELSMELQYYYKELSILTSKFPYIIKDLYLYRYARNLNKKDALNEIQHMCFRYEITLKEDLNIDNVTGDEVIDEMAKICSKMMYDEKLINNANNLMEDIQCLIYL